MQTFLPYASFSESAKVLDYRRLGKKRVECKQLLSALGYEIVNSKLVHSAYTKRGWINHPCSKMWKNYEVSLAVYQTVMILEWKRRGYNNTMDYLDPDVARLYMNPPWLGDEDLHASHRSNLIRKDPVHYGKFGWTEEPDLEYIWPPESTPHLALVA